MSKISKIIIATVLLCGYNLTVFAVTVEFPTLTAALAYNGNKATVTKLIITGQIAGDDYSEESEWSKFYNLDETFSNIEAVEILTAQDIPDGSQNGGLFFDGDDGSHWLKHFSASNTKKIGINAFYFCENLTSASFPLVATIGENAFAWCSNLTIVNFPLVTMVGNRAFQSCTSLISATFGTDFESETEIRFRSNVFWGSETSSIDLTLSEYVLPLPNLTVDTWQTTTGYSTGIPYVWKSITMHNNIDEVIKNLTVSIFSNPTVADFTVSFELEKSCNLQILLCDILGKEVMEIYDGFAVEGNFTQAIDVNNLDKGVYFLKIFANGNSTVKKIVIN